MKHVTSGFLISQTIALRTQMVSCESFAVSGLHECVLMYMDIELA